MPAAKHRRPRGHIRELPSGSFQVIVYAGTDPLTKKSRYLRETLKTYGAAEVALTRLQGQIDQNRLSPRRPVGVEWAGGGRGDHHGVPIFVPTRGVPPDPQSGWVHYVPDAATAMREARRLPAMRT